VNTGVRASVAPAVAPPRGFSRANLRIRSTTSLVHRRPHSAWALAEGGPLAAHELAVPAQDRLGAGQKDRPALLGQPFDDRRQHQPIAGTATSVGAPAVAALAIDAAALELQLGAQPARDREGSVGRPEDGRSSTAGLQAWFGMIPGWRTPPLEVPKSSRLTAANGTPSDLRYPALTPRRRRRTELTGQG